MVDAEYRLEGGRRGGQRAIHRGHQAPVKDGASMGQPLHRSTWAWRPAGAGPRRARQHRHAQVRVRRRLRRDRQAPGSRTPRPGSRYWPTPARSMASRTAFLTTRAPGCSSTAPICSRRPGCSRRRTYAELLAAADKLKADSQYHNSPRLLHAGCLLVRRHGVGVRRGTAPSPPRVRTASGPATCRTPRAWPGLQKWADLVKNYSKGDPTKDE